VNAPDAVPYIVAIGGTLRPNSSTERAMRVALSAAARAGARTHLISGAALEMPMYQPDNTARTSNALTLVRELAAADGLILGSPGYHGSISGLVKNALDYAEDLRGDVRPYLSGRAVGCIATAGGWPGAVNTLGALREIVHALRGWPTPLGAAINTSEGVFDEAGRCLVPRIGETLEHIAAEVLEFARQRAARRSSP
jgi:FMN reductase